VISEKLKPLMANNSVIRAMFEEGTKMKEAFGAENVYDFSLGNPNVPAPAEVNQSMIRLLTQSEPDLHAYMNNAGFPDVREAIAKSINKANGTNFHKGNILMTCGAAGGINVALNVIMNPGDEVLVFVPYFLEYNWYVNNVDGKVVGVRTDGDFMPDLADFEAKISDKTRVLLLNSPNNPTGVVYPAEVLAAISEILQRKQKELGRTLFILSDEPYRELAYDGTAVPYVTKFYPNTIVAYSFSKSLSLPGERIGYLVIPDEMEEAQLVFDTASNANRILGFVNAPSLIQKVIGECIDAKVDVAYYDRNRQTLYDMVTELGFQCIKPKGAFYLFMKSPLEDDKAFVEIAKKHRVLMVSGGAFGLPGYVRLAYCVSYETILNAKESFKKLAEETL
jgi:aspartate aminotransferase